jgi:aminoglycoside 2'-N-acetyltransferase I
MLACRVVGWPAHALDGVHVLVSDASGIVSDGALVPRRIEYAGRLLRAGYVEAVATRADRRRQGHARSVMQQLGDIIQRDFGFGLLPTGLHEVYEPLGWRRWKGASYVH